MTIQKTVKKTLKISPKDHGVIDLNAAVYSMDISNYRFEFAFQGQDSKPLVLAAGSAIEICTRYGDKSIFDETTLDENGKTTFDLPKGALKLPDGQDRETVYMDFLLIEPDSETGQYAVTDIATVRFDLIRSAYEMEF